ncbi:hypothetical protein ACT453_11550, partial [Bacillus sp. D-CC]
PNKTGAIIITIWLYCGRERVYVCMVLYSGITKYFGSEFIPQFARQPVKAGLGWANNQWGRTKHH